MKAKGEVVCRAKDVLDPRVLIREGAMNALWDGVSWIAISDADADRLIEDFVPVQGKNRRRETILHARAALNFWDQ